MKKFPKGYRKDWPYYDKYKDYNLEIYHDGSVNIVTESGKTMATHINLEDAFMDIDKTISVLNKDKMFKLPATISTTYHQTDFYNDCIQLGNCVTATPMPCQTAVCNNKQGNKPMYVDNDKHIESSKINYLSRRADGAFYTADAKIDEAFNLRKPKAPETPEDLIAAITSGNYTLLPKAERNIYDRVTNQIIWRAPTVVADEAGAKVARKVLADLYQTAQDAVMVSTPDVALAAVQALDTWTPTAGTVAS